MNMIFTCLIFAGPLFATFLTHLYNYEVYGCGADQEEYDLR